MSRTPRDVTGAELDILQLLWREGSLSVRDVSEILRPEQADAYYSTVKKLLERLDEKGFVSRERQGIAYIYEPAVDRDELIGRRLQNVAETLCEGSLTPLLTQLSRHDDLNEDQQKKLQALIDELDHQNQSNPKQRRRRK